MKRFAAILSAFFHFIASFAINRADVASRTKEIRTNISIKPKILVIGGSGRVGGSAVRALHSRFGDKVRLAIGGRDAQNWQKYAASNSLPMGSFDFESLDISNREQIDDKIQRYDMIIHTAGPFQGIKHPLVLESAMAQGKLYLDVCDDIALSRTARSENIQAVARATGGIAIISTGIWPGCSSLLAKKMVLDQGGVDRVDKVRFSFFTSGSGGAGPTILSATFLILGERVLTYVDGQEVFQKSATDAFKIDFGDGIGHREVARMNLIECESCHQMGINNVETFFGTAPAVWNTLFVLMANLIPQYILRDRSKMDFLGKLSLPLVRAVDAFVGSKNAIRVDLTLKSDLVETKPSVGDSAGDILTGILSHRDMEKSVGDAIAAFSDQLLCERFTLAGGTGGGSTTVAAIPPGVYFPEEVPSTSFITNILQDISKDSMLCSTNWKRSIAS